MTDVTQILNAIGQGDPSAAEHLLPLVYDELRKLAAQKLSHEKPGQTLQATALVHEAYVRLVGKGSSTKWDGRRHFFAAAAEAMRRILVEQARRKNRIRHGGEVNRVEMADAAESNSGLHQRIIEVDAALSRLSREDPLAAEVVKLHYFAGLPLAEVAKVLGMSRPTVYRQWNYARSWLRVEIEASS
jgi:RNA polymerase sigma factor (TIGR02999 family)